MMTHPAAKGNEAGAVTTAAPGAAERPAGARELPPAQDGEGISPRGSAPRGAGWRITWDQARGTSRAGCQAGAAEGDHGGHEERHPDRQQRQEPAPLHAGHRRRAVLVKD